MEMFDKKSTLSNEEIICHIKRMSDEIADLKKQFKNEKSVKVTTILRQGSPFSVSAELSLPYRDWLRLKDSEVFHELLGSNGSCAGEGGK